MTLKFDMKEAYDSMECDFIITTMMKRFGFSDSLKDDVLDLLFRALLMIKCFGCRTVKVFLL